MAENVLDLETMKETLRLEIRKELRIKEGAERLLKASMEKRSKSYVTTIVRNCNDKLEALHSELSALQAQVPDDPDGEYRYCGLLCRDVHVKSDCITALAGKAM